MTDKENFERLAYLAKHMTTEEVEEFESLLAQYVGKQDEETLKKLLHVFTNDTPFPEVMFSLVHLVEGWPHEIYIQTFLRQIDGSAIVWFEILLNRILNHPQCLKLFRKNMSLAPKEALLKLFELLEKESPHHRALVEELRREIEAKNKKC